MTREEMQKIEDVIFQQMQDKSAAARCVIEIRRAVGVSEGASRPGYAGSSGGAAYVTRGSLWRVNG